MSIWKKAAACAATAVAGLVLVASPASAAPPPVVTHFGPASDPARGLPGPSYGATWARGTITWLDRKVQLDGEVRVIGTDCRTATATTYQSDGFTRMGSASIAPRCTAGVHEFPLSVPAPKPGGASFVEVCLGDGSKTLDCSGFYQKSDG